MRYCSKCILPETYPGIAFNGEGVCNYCVSYQPQKPLGKEELMKVVNSVKGKGKYDCVVLLSGGKDSVFMMYYVVKELSLKAVAINYGSGVQSDLSIKNLENACKILNVPLVVKEADWQVQKKRMQYMLKFYSKLGKVSNCGGCSEILHTIAINYAKENNIPIIFDGGSIKEHHKPKEEMPDEKKSNSLIGKVINHIKTIVILVKKYRLYNFDISKFFYYYKYQYYDYMLREQMHVSAQRLPSFGYSNYFDADNIRMIRFSDYVEWPESKIVDLVTKELNWKKPAIQDKRFDCLLHFLTEYNSYQNYGISDNGPIYSNLIRCGLMDREDAVKKEDYFKKTIMKDCEELIKDKLELLNFKITGFPRFD